jgi:sulfite reductase (NADPH) flavoprotein alpha-component
MNAKTLERRGVGTVQQSLAGSLPDYRLAFTFEGHEGCEPRFANIEPLGEGGVPVQGVAHRLSRKQMKLLDGFEGEGSAYERISVAFVAAAADDDVLGETTRPSASFEVQAYVAMPSHTVPPGLPSKRYVKLLADGAAAHGLAAEYLAAIRAQPSFDCEGIVMPQPPVGARDVSFAELQQHGYRETGVWVAMGGLVFDVTSQAHGRAMLRNMSGGDGTRFVLRMWHAAYGGGGAGEAEEVARLEAAHTVLVEALPTAQREYVASWAQHLVARYPCVGVLRETRATTAGEQGCTVG